MAGGPRGTLHAVRPWLPALAAAAAAPLLGVACSHPVRNELVVHYDAGATDAGPDARPPPADAAPDANPYLGGPCVDDAQCDDQIACTYDSCDPSSYRCLNVPDSSQCQDGNYCDGQEVCVYGHGCQPGAIVSCDNGNECQIGTCVESTKSCAYAPRDVDQDGDPDARCVAKHDCNDLDPDVSSLHAEVCGNGVDDNCNGLIDEQPCVSPQGVTCASPIALGGPGTYAVSTVGANDTFATSCGVSKPAAGQNVVASVTVPPGPNVDLDVWVTGTVEVAVAVQASCGVSSSELACGSGAGATSVRARAYDVAPGTYYVVVTTQAASSVEVEVDTLASSHPPVNLSCVTAQAITPGTPLTIPVVGSLPTNLPTACPQTTGELTYSFALAQTQDVRVYASTVRGSGAPVIGLRDPGCTAASDELACEKAGVIALYQESVPSGTYVVTLAATSPIDATLDVELSAPTTPAPDQTCAAPPAVTANQRLSFDLANHESAIKDGCFPSGPDAAYDLSLARASDVLLVERIPQTESGGVSLDAPACDAASELACATGSTPIRVGRRNVPAGDARVVVADQVGLQGTLDVLVRDTVTPTTVPSGGAASCAQALDATAGGFFVGDTSTLPTATYQSGCDAPTVSGEKVQVLGLTLPQAARVVLDMEGSTYTTLLDVRQRPSCPGTPVGGACYVGFGAQKSFLDLELTAGAYWVLVSGYNGAAGAWQMDVRVLPP